MTEKISTQINVDAVQEEKFIEDDDASQVSASSAEKLWLMEIGAWMLSLTALLGIVIMLRVHEDNPAPYTLITKRIQASYKGYSVDQGIHFTINSFISLFSTVMKTSLAVPVAAAIGQLKWTWFRQSRPLSDFVLIEKSKGFLGSVMLLWRFRARHLVSLGAFLTMATLVLDFSLQSLVSYPLKPQKFQNATVLRTKGYSNYGIRLTATAAFTDNYMNAAVYSGLWGKASDINVNPVCSSNHCGWLDYTSLAVCSQCIDVSNQANQTCGDDYAWIDSDNQTVPDIRPYCNYTLPDGPMLAGNGDIDMNITSVSDGTFGSINNTFSMVTIVRGTWSNWTNSTPTQELLGVTAQRCALYMCVQRYSAQVINSTFQETVVSTFHDAPIRTRPDEGLIFEPDAQFLNGTQGRSQGYFAISNIAYNALQLQLNQFWPGYTDTMGYSSNNVAGLLYNYTDTETATRMGYLATSMTTAMRNAGDQRNASGSQSPSETSPLEFVTGITYIDTPYVVVQWLWIVLPASMLVLTLVFIVLTVMVSHGDGGSMLWKGQGLAAFYQPLTGDGRADLRRARTMGELEGIAGGLKVRWASTDKGWRLMKEREE